MWPGSLSFHALSPQGIQQSWTGAWSRKQKPEDNQGLPGRVEHMIREAAPSMEPQKDVETNIWFPWAQHVSYSLRLWGCPVSCWLAYFYANFSKQKSIPSNQTIPDGIPDYVLLINDSRYESHSINLTMQEILPYFMSIKSN